MKHATRQSNLMTTVLELKQRCSLEAKDNSKTRLQKYGANKDTKGNKENHQK
jgi:hypothetical protein